jgi:hypothetical protein
LIETPLQIQADVSWVKMWFGSGSSANSPGIATCPASPGSWKGRSCQAMPPMSQEATSPAVRPSSHSRAGPRNLGQTIAA